MANKQDVDLKFTLIDQVTKSLGAIQKSVSDVGTTLTKVNQAAELAGKAFNFAAGAAAKIGDAVSGAAALEDALARVGVRTNATTEQQVALQQAVESAVGATTFSAQEAAAALALLAEDGFSANDAAAQLGETLVFANAAAIDAAEATGLLGTVLDKFAASPDDISGIADALTATAAAAGASTKAIAEGLAGIGTAAKTANVSIEDSVAILGTLAVEGVESSAAVGRLNKIFQDFAEPASKFSVAIREAGLGGLEFVDVVAALQKDSAAASDVLATLGDKPREAMRLLLQEGGSDLESFTEIIDKSGGAAQAAADKLNNTFNGALTKLINQIELARTKLLLPILDPLTAQFEKFGTRISAFVQSEQFARITEQVTAFAEKTITAIGDTIESFDFEAAIASVEAFTTTAVENFEKIAAVASFIGKAIATVYDTVKGGSALLVESFTSVLSDVFAALGVFSDGAAELSIVFGDMAREARALGDEALKDLENRFVGTTEKSVELKKGIDDVKASAEEAKKPVENFANSVEKISGAAAKNTGPLDAFGNSLSDIGKTAEKAKSASFSMVEGIKAVSDEARKSEIRKLEIEYGKLLVAAENGGGDSGALAKVRDRLQELSTTGERAGKGANAAKDGVKDAADSADSAGQSFADYGAQAGIAAEESERLADSGGRVAESLEGVADAASHAGKAYETNSALGEKLTAAFLNASSDFGNYQQFFFQNLKNINDQAKIGNEALKEAVKLSELRDPQLQREVEIRKQLLEQYQVGGPELDKLVAIRVKEAEAADNEKLKQEAEQRGAVNKKVTESTKTLDEITAARERERKEREAGLAVGNQELAQNQQLVATQPKPGSVNNVTVNVNITGSQDSQAYWRRIVSEFILPELKRLERLEQ